MPTSAEQLIRAATAVTQSADPEATYYEAQTPVEDWALHALELALADQGEARNAHRIAIKEEP